MRDEQVLLNSTSQIKNFKLRSSSTGQLLSGKVAADFTGVRHVAGGTSTALSFSTGTAGDAYSSGKICPIGNGTYDWHIPNAMFTALGQSNATISCSGAIDGVFDFQVVAVDRDTAVYGAATPAHIGDTETIIVGNITASESALQANIDANETKIDTVIARIPTALVGGRMDSSVGAIADNAITESSIANNAITDAKVASDVTIASVTGAVGSVTAGVTVTTNNDKTGYTASTVTDKTGYSLTATTGLGNQTSNITGNLSGSVGSVTTVNDKTGYSLATAPPTASENATAVWASGTRTLSGFGTLVADVWANATRTLSAAVDANLLTVRGSTITAKAGRNLSFYFDNNNVDTTTQVSHIDNIRTEADDIIAETAQTTTITNYIDSDLVILFPANFAAMGINISGHVSRVTLVDTTTTNTDMRGTNNAMLAASYTAPDNTGIADIKTKTDLIPAMPASVGSQMTLEDGAITAAKIATGALTAAKFASGAFDAVWSVATRTLTAASDSSGITTLLTRITGLLQTKAQADTDQTAVLAAIDGINSGVGILSINLTFLNNVTSNAVPGVQASIVGSSVRDISDVMGLAALSVDPSTTYTIRFITPSGYETLADLSVVVASIDVNTTVSLTPTTITPSDDPELCNVLVRVISQYGALIDSADVWADLAQNVAYTSDAIIMDSTTLSTTVDGEVTLPLVRNQKYRIHVSYQDKQKTIIYTVPNTASATATIGA